MHTLTDGQQTLPSRSYWWTALLALPLLDVVAWGSIAAGAPSADPVVVGVITALVNAGLITLSGGLWRMRFPAATGWALGGGVIATLLGGLFGLIAFFVALAIACGPGECFS